MSDPIRITLSVTTDQPHLVASAAEHFARTAAGLALEGVSTHLMIDRDEDLEGDEI